MEFYQSAEKKFSETLDSTINKAKETYRKYDAYLESAEEAINFSWTFALATLDLIDHIFENLIREADTDLTAFFKQGFNEETDAKRKAAIDKLVKSEFLKKKKLFLDLARLPALRDELDLKEKQVKFDKLASLVAHGTQPRIPITVIKPGPNQEPPSLNSESNLPDNKEGPSKNNGGKINESFIHSNLTILTQNIINSKNMIENNPNVQVDPELLRELIQRTNEFISSIQNYFFNLKASFIEEDLNPPDANDPSMYDMENLEKTLTRLTALEKVELEKLVEIKQKSDRLRGVHQHVRRLANQLVGGVRASGKGPLQTRF